MIESPIKRIDTAELDSRMRQLLRERGSSFEEKLKAINREIIEAWFLGLRSGRRYEAHLLNKEVGPNVDSIPRSR